MTYKEVKVAIDFLKTISESFSEKNHINENILKQINSTLSEIETIPEVQEGDSLQDALLKTIHKLDSLFHEGITGETESLKEIEEKIKKCYKITIDYLTKHAVLRQIEMIEVGRDLNNYYETLIPHLDEDTEENLNLLWNQIVPCHNEGDVFTALKSTISLAQNMKAVISELSRVGLEVSADNPDLKEACIAVSEAVSGTIKKINSDLSLYRLLPSMIAFLNGTEEDLLSDITWETHTHEDHHLTTYEEEHSRSTSHCIEFSLDAKKKELENFLFQMLRSEIDDHIVNHPLFEQVKSKLEEVLEEQVKWNMLKAEILSTPPDNVSISVINKAVDCIKTCLGISIKEALDVLESQVEHDGRKLIDFTAPSIERHKQRLISEENSFETLRHEFIADIDAACTRQRRRSSEITPVEEEIRNISLLGKALIDNSSYSENRYRILEENATRIGSKRAKKEFFEIKIKKAKHDIVRSLIKQDTLDELRRSYTACANSEWEDSQKREVLNPLITQAYMNIVEGFRCLYPKELHDVPSSKILKKLSNQLDPVTLENVGDISGNTSILDRTIALLEIKEVIDKDPNLTPEDVQNRLKEHLPTIASSYEGREIPLNNQVITSLKALKKELCNDLFLTDNLRKILGIEVATKSRLSQFLRSIRRRRRTANSTTNSQQATATMLSRKLRR